MICLQKLRSKGFTLSWGLLPGIDNKIWSSSKHAVKSGIFGQTAKFGQRPCLFHISNIGIKNKLTKQTVKILMIRSRLILIYTVCKCVSEFTWCLNLSDFTLIDGNAQRYVLPHIPENFQGVTEMILDHLTKSSRVDFVTHIT